MMSLLCHYSIGEFIMQSCRKTIENTSQNKTTKNQDIGIKKLPKKMKNGQNETANATKMLVKT